MAVLSAILVPSGQPATVVSNLAATTSSAELLLGPNVIFALNATQDITVAFGVTGMAAAGVNNFRVPANATVTMDLGQAYTAIRVYNLSSNPANVYLQPMSRF